MYSKDHEDFLFDSKKKYFVIPALYHTYGKQCINAKCDSIKRLVCTTSGRSKTMFT